MGNEESVMMTYIDIESIFKIGKMGNTVFALHRFFDWLHTVGWDDSEGIVFKVAVTVVVAVLFYFLVRKWLSLLIRKMAGDTIKSVWNNILCDQRFFRKLSALIPPLSAYVILGIIDWEYEGILHRLVDIWLLVVILFICTSLLTVVNRIYESYPVSRNRPITFFIQLIKVFLYTVAVITVISILVGKSPEHLIVGLSAFAAVLLLVFKDSILGFVAGIQLTANKMIRIGDWIQMDRNNADGTVLEVNLYTVKVQNWDMTVSMIPTYQLVSESFTNWRGMQESGGRRIMRSINIDMNTVHFLSRAEFEKFTASAFLKDYLEKVSGRMEKANEGKLTVLDEWRLTNIGVFRHYMEAWIEANPGVNVGMLHMVRQLQPGPTGMPIQIYCFSTGKEWAVYERLQAEIFDHIMAVLPEFGLKVYEYPGQYAGE